MKRLTIFAALILCGGLLHAESESPLGEPILLTSCGQSADVLMMRTILTRDSLEFNYAETATPTDLKDKGSLMLVLGGSSKGLGAAKISADDEAARVKALLEAAEKAKIPVIAIHLGGTARRGALSDSFIQLGAAEADQIVVVKGGNDDGLFTKIAEEKKIPIETAETGLGVASILKRLYRSE